LWKKCVREPALITDDSEKGQRISGKKDSLIRTIRSWNEWWNTRCNIADATKLRPSHSLAIIEASLERTISGLARLARQGRIKGGGLPSQKRKPAA
jgi:hypothetical protein